MTKLKHISIVTLSVLIFSSSLLFTPIRSVKAGEFDPNYIISDAEVLDYSSMSFEEIKRFLQNKGSYLANYSCANPEGKIMTAAEIIFDRATTNRVNPKFIIALIQKEQSLIEDTNPAQGQLDWAAGYGCPDGDACNSRWKGFWKQVNSATLQFRDYMDNPQLYKYRMGETYTFSNPYGTISNATVNVTPVCQATAALYNYTPHVYNGNYNFYKIWQRYFTRNYPDGTLLQASGEAGVWLIEAGKKRPFLSRGALTSRYDVNRIVTVTKSDLDKYEKGTPIKYAQYSLIRSPKGTIYLLVDDKRRGFADGEVFRKIGINPEEVVDASWDDVNNYIEAAPLTATSTFPTGALLQDRTSGGVYWVMDGEKAPIWDAVFLKTKFKDKKIIPTRSEELANYLTIKPVIFGDGEILKSAASPSVFIISNGQKRPFVSGAIFEGLGYNWKNVITVSERIINLYPEGEPMVEVTGG